MIAARTTARTAARMTVLFVALVGALLVSSALELHAQEAPARPRAGERVLAIVGGDVHTGTGIVYRRGTVLCRGGKIEAVGVDLDVPQGAQVIDATGRWVLPGFVAPRGGNFGIRRGRPAGGEKFGAVLDPKSLYAELALAAGITAYFGEGRGRGSYSDANAVIKPAYGAPELMIVKEPAALTVNWTRASGADRTSLRSTLASGKRWLKAGSKGRAPGSTSLMNALQRKIPVRIAASSRGDIRQALSLAEEFDLKLVLLNATEAWTMPEDISAAGAIPVVIPRRRVWAQPGEEARGGSKIETASILERAGVPFCLLPPGGFGGGGHGISLGGISGRDMLTYPLEGAFAIRGGASSDAALRAITLTAAEALGVEDRLGSLERGKDADIVIYQGDPFDYRKVAEMTIVSGRVLYDRKKSTLFAHLPQR